MDGFEENFQTMFEANYKEELMAEQFLHGVEVSEISSGPRTIRTTKSSMSLV
jgi:hypothetical protein